METIRVWVVTCPELGWDCVIGVFSGQITEAEMLKRYPVRQYHLDSKVIHLQPEQE